MRGIAWPIVISFAWALLGCKAKEAPPRGGHAVPRDAGGGATVADARPVAGIADRVAGARVAATPLTAPVTSADYLLIVPAGSDVEQARQLAERALATRQIAQVAEPPPTPPSTLVARLHADSLDALDFEPGFLERSLGGAELEAVLEATHAVVLTVLGPPAKMAEVQHAGAEIAVEIARSSRGWIVDRWSDQAFTAASFDEQRPRGFALDVRRLVILYQIRDAQSAVYLETHGLKRFGVPELILRGIPGGISNAMGQLVNAAGQMLVERGAVSRDGVLEVAGSAGSVTFGAIWSVGGDSEPGASPDLIELQLPGEGEVPPRAFAAMHAAFGHVDEVREIHPDQDPALLAARARARDAFATLAPRFAAGVPDGENVSVKSPFRTDAGEIELMWVELETSKGDVLTGILLNEPFQPAGAHAGDRVEVKASEIVDYRHVHADGTIAGDETTRLLQARTQAGGR